jgi:flagellar hook-associated protein 1 FlgK
MGVSPALHTALSSLLAQQVGLNVIGHNIANASTEGYSRQRVNLIPYTATRYTYGAIGQGVMVDGIERIVDDFVNNEIRSADNGVKSQEIYQTAYNRLEGLFDELSGNDLSTAVDRFFKSLHDLSATVESQPTREQVIQEAQTLREMVNSLSLSMTEYRATLDKNVVDQADQVNGLLDEIAHLNVRIGINEGTTGSPENDLRDVRDMKLRELAGLIDINVAEQPNGSVSVSTKGMPLVIYERSYHLATRLSTSENMAIHEVYFEDGGAPLLTTTGSLPATMEARDHVVRGFMDDLDQFAASLIFEFNRIHSQGVGTEALTAVTAENAPLDPSIALDRMNLGFVPMPGTFQVRNGSLTISLVNSVTGQTSQYLVPVDLDGVGADTSLNDLVAAINAAVPAGTLTASLDVFNRLKIQSQDPATYSFFFSEDTSGVLATLGVNTFFSGHDAASMSVNPLVASDVKYLATGRTTAPGDGDNLMALIDLRDQAVLAGGTQTLEEYYRTMVGRMGAESSRNSDKLEVGNDVLTRLENERENISGVSIDEEMTAMIEYQRADAW